MRNYFKKLIFIIVLSSFVFLNVGKVLAVPEISLTITDFLLGAKIVGMVTDPTQLVENYNIELGYSLQPSPAIFTPITTNRANRPNHTWYFEGKIDTLTANTPYYIKVTIDTISPIPPYAPISKEVKHTRIEISTPEIKSSVENNSLDKEYKLLAPFAGLKIINTPADCAEIIKNNPDKPVVCDINTLISFIFRTLVGLTAVFMVIRLMLIGYNYMLTDTPFQKSKAKEDFLATLSGLVLALSAWLILNTINPKLLENNFAVETISVSVFSELPMLVQEVVTMPTGQLKDCKLGADTASTENGIFYICKSYIPEFIKLISDANKAGFKLTGGGFRTRQEQTDLRIEKCNGDFKNANAKCSPPVALPGESNHESGLAVDLKCNGKLVNWSTTGVAHQPAYPISAETKKCFEWLKANSGKMTNLQSENWHWEYPPSN